MGWLRHNNRETGSTGPETDPVHSCFGQSADFRDEH